MKEKHRRWEFISHFQREEKFARLHELVDLANRNGCQLNSYNIVKSWHLPAL